MILPLPWPTAEPEERRGVGWKGAVMRISRGTNGCARWKVAVENTWRVRNIRTKTSHIHGYMHCMLLHYSVTRSRVVLFTQGLTSRLCAATSILKQNHSRRTGSLMIGLCGYFLGRSFATQIPTRSSTMVLLVRGRLFLKLVPILSKANQFDDGRSLIHNSGTLPVAGLS